jgi:regulator of replication initiation timing
MLCAFREPAPATLKDSVQTLEEETNAMRMRLPALRARLGHTDTLQMWLWRNEVSSTKQPRR